MIRELLLMLFLAMKNWISAIGIDPVFSTVTRKISSPSQLQRASPSTRMQGIVSFGYRRFPKNALRILSRKRKPRAAVIPAAKTVDSVFKKEWQVVPFSDLRVGVARALIRLATVGDLAYLFPPNLLVCRWRFKKKSTNHGQNIRDRQLRKRGQIASF